MMIIAEQKTRFSLFIFMFRTIAAAPAVVCMIGILAANRVRTGRVGTLALVPITFTYLVVYLVPMCIKSSFSSSAGCRTRAFLWFWEHHKSLLSPKP